MKATVIISSISEADQNQVKGSLKLTVKQQGFDSQGSMDMSVSDNGFSYSDTDMEQVIKNVDHQFYIDMISKIEKFLIEKWELYKSGKFKFSEGFEFLVKF